MFRTTLAIGLLTFASASFGAGDAANGEKLFAASECLSCHGTEVFSAPDRKVKDLIALDTQVRLCDSNLNTNWFDTEIHDVVAYLNQQYYKFPTPAE
jgi:mono/diheme cytochrome c family protein